MKCAARPIESHVPAGAGETKIEGEIDEKLLNKERHGSRISGGMPDVGVCAGICTWRLRYSIRGN